MYPEAAKRRFPMNKTRFVTVLPYYLSDNSEFAVSAGIEFA